MQIGISNKQLADALRNVTIVSSPSSLDKGYQVLAKMPAKFSVEDFWFMHIETYGFVQYPHSNVALQKLEEAGAVVRIGKGKMSTTGSSVTVYEKVSV